MNSTAENNNNNTKKMKDNSKTTSSASREHFLKRYKQSLFEKIDCLKENFIKHSDSPRVSISHPITPSASGSVADFNKVSLQQSGPLTRETSIFRPAAHKTIIVPAKIGFNYGANVYNQKHNMIIACPSNNDVHFLDATTFRAMKNRPKKSVGSSVVQMSYYEQSETYLIGCAFGEIYTYNASTNDLHMVMKQHGSILAITHISPTVFAFSSNQTEKIFFGDVTAKKAEPHFSFDSDAWYLHSIKEQNILLAGLANGMIAIYNTRRGPKYPMIDSIRSHGSDKIVTSIVNVKIKGRNYIVTGGNDSPVKIWHFVKGKMRLLKSIPGANNVSTLVYLEEYKMIATTHHESDIKFFKLPSGKLEATLPLGLERARNTFSMSDKKCIGVADLSKNVIKVVKLNSNVVAQSR